MKNIERFIDYEYTTSNFIDFLIDNIRTFKIDYIENINEYISDMRYFYADYIDTEEQEDLFVSDEDKVYLSYVLFENRNNLKSLSVLDKRKYLELFFNNKNIFKKSIDFDF